MNNPPDSKARADAGLSKAIEILKGNPLVNGNEDIAQAILDRSKEHAFKKGYILIRQGAVDDSVYFLMQGVVEVRISGKTRIVTREAPLQVGEMAALNGTDTRSATVRAKSERIVVREISAHDFNEIGRKFPDFLNRALIDQNTRNKAWKASGTEAKWIEKLVNSRTLALVSALLAALILAGQLVAITSIWIAALVFFGVAAVLLFLSFWLNRTRFLYGCFMASGLSVIAFLTNPFAFSVEVQTGPINASVASQALASTPALITLIVITALFLGAAIYSHRHEK
ncbi:cyclic nucleotide-binding domain-containing protein [Cucumibacter marinus]|uniref:cyclic nucleotide-binding domain-containing protein n=1 Tax=Cucumibacter marinus TaxID=1121252 RepID=UPI00048F275D|nr:cyclic nucleotide-binding domain-containing protein [Cucumibacter marinus]